jgi:hypothetical protein
MRFKKNEENEATAFLRIGWGLLESPGATGTETRDVKPEFII